MRLYLILKFLYRVFKRVTTKHLAILHNCIVKSNYQSNPFDGYPVHSVSLRDKLEQAIILDKTLQNASLQASKFVWLQL